MELRLTKQETEELENDDMVLVVRRGIELYVEKDNAIEGGYRIDLVNPYDKVVMAK